MNRARLLALNALSFLVANIVSKIILFGGSIFIFQYLDPNGESSYHLAMSFALLMSVNFQDGMVLITIRRIAHDCEKGAEHLGTLFLGSVLLSVALLLITIPAALIYGSFQIHDVVERTHFLYSVLALTGAMLMGYGYAVAGAGFKAYEKLYLESILVVIQAIFNAGVYWYGAKHQWPLEWFFMGLLATNLFHSILSLIVLRLFVTKIHFHTRVLDAWQVFRESLGLGYATLLRTLQDRIHPFFIGGIIGQSAITQFSSPNNLLSQLKFIPTSVRPALFPTLARKAQLDTGEFQYYSLGLMKFLYLTALPIMILLIIARYQILPLNTTMAVDFKTTYKDALAVYPIIGWMVALSFPSQVLKTLFVSIKKPEFEFRTVLAGVSIMVVLDLILIRRMGIIGAGYAAFVCEAVILGYGLWLLHKVGRGLSVMSLFLLPTLCGIITHLLAGYLYGVYWLYGVLAVVVVFPVLVLLFRVITPTEWAIFREIIKPRKPSVPLK